MSKQERIKKLKAELLRIQTLSMVSPIAPRKYINRRETEIKAELKRLQKKPKRDNDQSVSDAKDTP